MLSALLALAMKPTTFRPPCVPLLVTDPYFSIWSSTDKLADSWTKHWTGENMALCGLVRVDGKTYRFSGTPDLNLPALEQIDCRVEATTTYYTFQAPGAKLGVKNVT